MFFLWPETPNCSFLFLQETEILVANSASPTLSLFDLASSHQLFPLPSLGCNCLSFRHTHFSVLEILHRFSFKWCFQNYIIPNNYQELSLSSLWMIPSLHSLFCLPSLFGHWRVLGSWKKKNVLWMFLVYLRRALTKSPLKTSGKIWVEVR